MHRVGGPPDGPTSVTVVPDVTCADRATTVCEYGPEPDTAVMTRRCDSSVPPRLIVAPNGIGVGGGCGGHGVGGEWIEPHDSILHLSGRRWKWSDV